tara:strand:+ start:2975 stop:4375 length:1401 start_codon:yes stop_codon:yes gene_type:complete
MKYFSSRDSSANLFSFEHVLLDGLARDGGLYLPESWKKFDSTMSLSNYSDYADLAAKIMGPYTEPKFDRQKLIDLSYKSYENFTHPLIAPLVNLADNLWLLELFHGPTLAFKDFALQVVGKFFNEILNERNEHITIIGATSGDTGSAAIEAFRGLPNISIFILYPEGRISEVQRRQMTSVIEKNVHTIGVDGSFDDCQTLVKNLFQDLSFRERMKLGAVNSINWGRILAQTVYYWHASINLRNKGYENISFVVPTGNFGNVFAGWVAAQSGLEIKNLVVATNQNDILTRFFKTGIYKKLSVIQTLSPSMDIQIASNFERLLYYILGCNGSQVTNKITGLLENNEFSIDNSMYPDIRKMFIGVSIDDETTLKTISRVYSETGFVVDPHTATAIAAANKLKDENGKFPSPTVCLATAHPAKFPLAVQKAIGIKPEIPDKIADLMDREERIINLPNDLIKLKDFIRAHS